jgi:hypothetical protein
LVSQALDEGKVIKKMRKIQIVGLALVAVFALSAVAASSAFAHEWLFNGQPITGTEKTVLSESTALNLLLEDMKGGVFGEAVDVLCSGLDEGKVGPGAADLVTTITDLAGKVPPVSCETMSGTCPEPLASPDFLPWHTELFLNAKEEFRDLVGPGTGGEPGWNVTCKGIFGEPIEDLCTGHTNVLVENAAENDVIATFDAVSMEEPANCGRGGAKEGLVEGSILFMSDEGALAVS